MQLKIFELCLRNFEITYIAMIRELSEKTFKLNLEIPIEKSIIMKKRESKNESQMKKAKLVEN